ncbi:hypothetical protein V865_005271 [Kwoniella europaea PYCC6329]|uniref:Uncharacterized protein n=1 Tax=Kwoniella europaea PYCC6329 TaxID=1423913 RepID=A0AAX4KLX9_9TREE
MSSQQPNQYTEGSVVNGHQLRGIPAVASPTPSTQWGSNPASTYRNGATPHQNGRSGPSQGTTPARSVGSVAGNGRGHSRNSSGSTSTGAFSRNIAWDVEETDENSLRLSIDFEAEHTGQPNASVLVLFPNDPRSAHDFETWFQQTRLLGGYDPRSGARMNIANAVESQLRPVDRLAESVRGAIGEVLEDFWTEYRHRD